MKKNIILLSFFVLMTKNCFSQTMVPGGMVSGTWSLAGSPYLIQGSIQIANGALLTIMPGVTVNFQGNYQLQVNGQLLSVGTSADTIFFTSADTAVGWESVRFPNTAVTNDTSKIMFCKFTYGKATGSSSLANGGAICFTNFSKAIVSNCTISNCTAAEGGAIYCDFSNVLITRNTIEHNSATGTSGGGGIYCGHGSPIISYNKILYNTAESGAGVFGEWYSSNTGSPIISNNIISYNFASLTGGGISCWDDAVLSFNTITNNTVTIEVGGGIDVGYNAVISDNVIANNFANGANAGGVFVRGGTPYFSNNTIVNNSATNGGGIYFDDACTPTFRNCILWGNTATGTGAQVFLYDEPSDPNFYYCDVQGGTAAFELNGNFYTGTYTNNINANPTFSMPSSGSGSSFDGLAADWSLQPGSPCINTGDPSGTYPATDINGNPRVNSVIIDMGAYEFQGSTEITNYDSQSPISIYPNPTSDRFYINANTTDKLNVDLYDANGKHVFNTSTSDKSNIDITALDEGIYILTIKTVHQLINKKLVILR